jgi:hypothetical protein
MAPPWSAHMPCKSNRGKRVAMSGAMVLSYLTGVSLSGVLALRTTLMRCASFRRRLYHDPPHASGKTCGPSKLPQLPKGHIKPVDSITHAMTRGESKTDAPIFA